MAVSPKLYTKKLVTDCRDRMVKACTNLPTHCLLTLAPPHSSFPSFTLASWGKPQVLPRQTQLSPNPALAKPPPRVHLKARALCMLSGFIQAGNLEIDLQQVMDIETASCVPAVGELHCQMVPLHAYKVDHNLCLSLLGWNGRDCINGQKTTPRIRRWNDHAGSQKSLTTPWSRHPASKNGAQQRCQGLFPFSQDALEDEIETDSCKSRSPTISSPLPKHCSSIVGAVQENPKFTSCRATNSSSKVRTKFLAFHIQNDLTNFMQKKKSIWLVFY